LAYGVSDGALVLSGDVDSHCGGLDVRGGGTGVELFVVVKNEGGDAG